MFSPQLHCSVLPKYRQSIETFENTNDVSKTLLGTTKLCLFFALTKVLVLVRLCHGIALKFPTSSFPQCNTIRLPSFLDMFNLLFFVYRRNMTMVSWVNNFVLDDNFFFSSTCSRAAEGIEDLCNETMADPWTADGEWLFAVPLLHFLRGDSKPFEEPHMAGSYNKPEWIGAQKLRIKEFQRSEKQ